MGLWPRSHENCIRRACRVMCFPASLVQAEEGLVGAELWPSCVRQGQMFTGTPLGIFVPSSPSLPARLTQELPERRRRPWRESDPLL